MKAFCLVLVIVLAAMPARANEMSAPRDTVLIQQSHASRLYSQERITALRYDLNTRKQTSIRSSGAKLLPEHQAVVDGARSERVRRLIKAALLRVEQAAVGAQTIRYKIRVSCKTKRRIARYPALATAAVGLQADAQPTYVASKSEACSVRLLIARTPATQDDAPHREANRPQPQMSDFAITLPDLPPAEVH